MGQSMNFNQQGSQPKKEIPFTPQPIIDVVRVGRHAKKVDGTELARAYKAATEARTPAGKFVRVMANTFLAKKSEESTVRSLSDNVLTRTLGRKYII